MRFINSLRNSSLAFVGQIITILMGFVLRWFFIHTFGQEYLGVNSVMESVLTLLSMTELGIGTSVAFALYKPINDADQKRIGSLMAFYRRVYHLIGTLTAVLGVILIPFMRFFTREVADVANMNLIYILFLTNTVLSYFFSYKRTLLSAYQQNYINSVSEDLFAVLKYIFQGIAIVVFRSYIGYLIINLVCCLGTNIVISVMCDKKYPLVNKYKSEKLSDDDKALLKKSVVSLMFQKVGGKLVVGTDNLMISYVNIALMGIYSNYSLVIGVIERVVTNVMRSIMGSVGNLMVQNDNKHKYKVYEEFVFTTFCCFFFIAAVLSGCLERFIGILAGEDWILAPKVTFVVIMNFYLQGTRQPNIAVIDTAGLFNKIRLKAVFEVLVNLVVSFLFLIVFKMGIYGVLFGTTVSKLGVCIWWEAWAVHKYSFNMSGLRYSMKYLKSVAVTAVGCFAAYFISDMIPVGGFAGLVLSGIVSVVVFALLIIPVYYKSEEFRSVLARFVKNH